MKYILTFGVVLSALSGTMLAQAGIDPAAVEGEVKAATAAEAPSYTLDNNKDFETRRGKDLSPAKDEVQLINAEDLKTNDLPAASGAVERVTAPSQAPKAEKALPPKAPAKLAVPKVEGLTQDVAPSDEAQAVNQTATKVPAPATPETSANTAPAPAVDSANTASSSMQSAGAEANAGEGVYSNGERIFIEGKGFSIVPPTGWLIRRDIPRTSLFLRAAPITETEYPRNIAVLKFSGPEVINEASAEKYGQYLVKNYPSASTEIADYQLRNHQMIPMTDGRQAILYYTDFSVNGVPMMQAHILASSETAHYLISFTDIAEHFENPQGDSEFLATAWASMTSIELDSPNPQPLESVQSTAIVIGVIVLLGGMVAYARHRAAGSVYRDYGDMDPGEAAELDPKTNAVEGDSTSYVSDVGFNEHKTSVDHAVKTEQGQILEFRSRKKDAAQPSTEAPAQWNLSNKDTPSSDFKDVDETPKDQWKVS